MIPDGLFRQALMKPTVINFGQMYTSKTIKMILERSTLKSLKTVLIHRGGGLKGPETILARRHGVASHRAAETQRFFVF